MIYCSPMSDSYINITGNKRRLWEIMMSFFFWYIIDKMINGLIKKVIDRVIDY